MKPEDQVVRRILEIYSRKETRKMNHKDSRNGTHIKIINNLKEVSALEGQDGKLGIIRTDSGVISLLRWKD